MATSKRTGGKHRARPVYVTRTVAWPVLKADRKNYLFVGDVAAGKSLAGLYSVVATCEARGINPFEYLVDVLPRVQDHPAARLDDLLPGAWAAR